MGGGGQLWRRRRSWCSIYRGRGRSGAACGARSSARRQWRRSRGPGDFVRGRGGNGQEVRRRDARSSMRTKPRGGKEEVAAETVQRGAEMAAAGAAPQGRRARGRRVRAVGFASNGGGDGVAWRCRCRPILIGRWERGGSGERRWAVRLCARGPNGPCAGGGWLGWVSFAPRGVLGIKMILPI